nr:DUF3850 domain-containing protein [Paraburkholderia aspalathi]
MNNPSILVCKHCYAPQSEHVARYAACPIEGMGNFCFSSLDSTADVQLAQVHELKTDPEPFSAVLSGEKTHEVRTDDRNFKVGDTLVLKETRFTRREMFELGWPLEYTGRRLTRFVTHIQRGYGLPDNLVVMSLAVPH